MSYEDCERTEGIDGLEDVFATVLLLGLVDDLEELFDGDSTVTRDVSLFNNLIHLRL